MADVTRTLTLQTRRLHMLRVFAHSITAYLHFQLLIFVELKKINEMSPEPLENDKRDRVVK